MNIRFLTIVCLLIVMTYGSPVHADDDSYKIEGARFWIGESGPVGPIFSGPHQYPFVCFTFENGFGQPIIDNQDGLGNAVFPEVDGIPIVAADPVGYSENCSMLTRVDYFYYSTAAEDFLPLANPFSVPTDVEKIIIKGKLVNFVVRLERGTINRFIYSIAMLAPYVESLNKPNKLDNRAWNKKLVYKFRGGSSGLGHWQGNFSLSKTHALHYESLKRGFAVAYSTGTRTGTHYNLRLAEETALMVKAHFGAIYGKPKFTIGVGGSGGAIQQYVIAQNNEHLLDGALAQMSYPDMITQTIHIADCELLERYFDAEYTLDPTSRWGDWQQRSLIQGTVTNNTAIVDPWSASPYSPFPGSSECINGWRGTFQAMYNPAWTFPEYYSALALYRYPAEVVVNIKWSHFNDLGNIYPQDDDGFAYNTWDNVGVQYGLRAFTAGQINADEFLDINACIGGWRRPQDMVVGNYPWDPKDNPANLDPWDQLNMTLNPFCKLGQVAPRTTGNVSAMNAAYNSGHVFRGDIDIPIIDVRWYLEPILDMHHTQASFAARARMINAAGDAGNQIIWFAECSNLDPVYLQDSCAFDPTGIALDVMDQWLSKRHSEHRESARPTAAVDSCFNGLGQLIYAGTDAWHGILDDKTSGACTSAFPLYSTSRRVAGGGIRGDVFKCALKPVPQAVADGEYGDRVFTASQLSFLNHVFPGGVCDYNQADLGIPADRKDSED